MSCTHCLKITQCHVRYLEEGARCFSYQLLQNSSNVLRIFNPQMAQVSKLLHILKIFWENPRLPSVPRFAPKRGKSHWKLLLLSAKIVTKNLHVYYFLPRDTRSANFRGVLRKTHVFWTRVRNDSSRSSKFVDFGTNRNRVRYFLLIISSNIRPILPRFRDIADFLLRRATPPLFHANFWGVPLGLDCRCCGSEERRHAY